jgi:hypothetical protein
VNPGDITSARQPTWNGALLAGQLAVLQAEARTLGLFAGDRELLECLNL